MRRFVAVMSCILFGLAVMRERARRRDIVMATIDGDPEAVTSIRRGGLIGIDTAQFCGPLGAESMRWTHRLLRGEKVPRQVLVTVFLGNQVRW